MDAGIDRAEIWRQIPPGPLISDFVLFFVLQEIRIVL